MEELYFHLYSSRVGQLGKIGLGLVEIYLNILFTICIFKNCLYSWHLYIYRNFKNVLTNRREASCLFCNVIQLMKQESIKKHICHSFPTYLHVWPDQSIACLTGPKYRMLERSKVLHSDRSKVSHVALVQSFACLTSSKYHMSDRSKVLHIRPVQSITCRTAPKFCMSDRSKVSHVWPVQSITCKTSPKYRMSDRSKVSHVEPVQSITCRTGPKFSMSDHSKVSHVGPV